MAPESGEGVLCATQSLVRMESAQSVKLTYDILELRFESGVESGTGEITLVL
jgi:hypothetical protein